MRVVNHRLGITVPAHQDGRPRRLPARRFASAFVGAAIAIPLMAPMGRASAYSQVMLASPVAPPQYRRQIFDAGGIPPLSPNATAVAADGTIYASDQGGNRIVKVNPTTGSVTELSSAANGWGHPGGLFLEADQQHLWVADKDHDRVVRISVSDGSFTRVLGGSTVLDAPESLTADGSGTYVNDTYQHRVVKLDRSSGTVVWVTSTCAGTPVLRNRGITFGSDGNLYVSDTDNARIIVIDPGSGNCLRAFGTRGTGNGQLSEPRGISADGQGGLWVAENGGARIQHLAENGTFIFVTPTTFGSKIGQFRSPHGVQVVGNMVYVSDTYNYRIGVYAVAPDGSATLANTISEPLPAPGGFNAPYSLAYGPGGELYVVDHFNSRVEKFNADGSFGLQFGGEGARAGSFNFPRGLVVMPGGTRVMVCDSENHRMQLFTSAGAYVSRLTPVGTTFLRPQEINLGPDGTLWVADTNNHRVLNVDLSGNVLHAWAGAGRMTPRGITVDSVGNVYVSDNTRQVVEEYDPTGRLKATLATAGNGPTQVRAPDGLAISSASGQDTLFITDTGNNRIVEMTTTGSPILTFGTKGTGNGEFTSPNSVAVGPTGQVAVSDEGNNRISIWQS